jgi:hypothetical protein
MVKTTVGKQPKAEVMPRQSQLPSKSHTRRQSIWHLPWHLNSLPRPPILPPHSGHTQFRMLETTSVVALNELNLTNDIRTLP